jgi:hypothetical protein
VRIEVVAVYLRHGGQWRGGLFGLGSRDVELS